MRAPAAFVLALVTAGCGASRSDLEERALAPLGKRAEAFDAGADGLEGLERESYYWLLWRSARRHAVDGSQADVVDVTAIGPGFLRRRVEQAREARRWPWAPVDQDAWLRGVLMYRVATEELSDWHAEFAADRQVRSDLEALAAGWDADREGTLRAVIHRLNSGVVAARTAPRQRGLPDMSPGDCLAEGGGRQTDLAIASICLLRTWGVPAILLRAPVLAGEPGGDVWIGILGTDWWIRPGDDAPLDDAYFRYRRSGPLLPKVFACADRNEFGHLLAARNSLSFKTAYNFILIPAADLTGTLPGTARVVLPAEWKSPVFLSTWSAGGWLEVAPGIPDGRGATDFGPCTAADLLYMPTVPGPRGIPAPAGDPFLLAPDGTRTLLTPRDGAVSWEWNPPADAPAARPHLWKDAVWVPCVVEPVDGKSTARGAPGALYLVIRPGPENGGIGKFFGRPFTLDPDGRHIPH